MDVVDRLRAHNLDVERVPPEHATTRVERYVVLS